MLTSDQVTTNHPAQGPVKKPYSFFHNVEMWFDKAPGLRNGKRAFWSKSKPVMPFTACVSR